MTQSTTPSRVAQRVPSAPHRMGIQLVICRMCGPPEARLFALCGERAEIEENDLRLGGR